MNEHTTLAVFDFDHTLIEGDSLWPFLVYAAGLPRVLLAVAAASFLLARRYLKNRTDPEIADTRTFVKAHLLRRLLGGRTATELLPAIEKLRGWQKWNEPMRRALREHYEKGHRIVIASGGLDLYLPELLNDLPPRALICTRMEANEGVFTGEMLSGNCVRAKKAEILANYILRNGPFVESWGYGNFPHDVEMLELLQHRIIV